MDTTSIIQWNVQGIHQRKDEILELSKSFQASIIAAQETFLWENSNFKIPNFNCLRKDGHFNVRGHGGVALFIRENIPYKEITLSTTLTAIAAQITINSTFTICNIYLPPSRTIDRGLLQNLYQQLPQPCLIVGDFNAHSRLWDSTRQNPDQRGSIIENFINSKNLILLNNGDPTRIQGPHESAIDLSICSPRLSTEINWSVLNSPQGSDHCPIIMQINTRNQSTQTSIPKLWNTKKALWDLYTSSPAWKDIPDPSPYNNSFIISDLYSRFERACSESIPTRSEHKYYPNPWWNEELSLSKLLREQAYQDYRRNKTLPNELLWKRLRAQHKYRVKTFKRKTWREYISNINRNTPMKTIYDTMRKIKGYPPKKNKFSQRR